MVHLSLPLRIVGTIFGTGGLFLLFEFQYFNQDAYRTHAENCSTRSQWTEENMKVYYSVKILFFIIWNKVVCNFLEVNILYY